MALPLARKGVSVPVSSWKVPSLTKISSLRPPKLNRPRRNDGFLPAAVCAQDHQPLDVGGKGS